MHRLLSVKRFSAFFIAVCILFVDVTETLAQSEPGHVYTVRSHKVHPGKTAEYHKVYADVVRPVLDKLKADGDIVSYRDIVKVFGTQQTTHVLVVEYASESKYKRRCEHAHEWKSERGYEYE